MRLFPALVGCLALLYYAKADSNSTAASKSDELDILEPKKDFSAEDLASMNKGESSKDVFTDVGKVVVKGEQPSELKKVVEHQKAMEKLGDSEGGQSSMQKTVGKIVRTIMCRMRVGMNIADDSPQGKKIFATLKISKAYLAHRKALNQLVECVKDELSKLTHCAEQSIRAQEAMLTDPTLGKALNDVQRDLYKLPGFKAQYESAVKKAGCDAGKEAPGLFGAFEDPLKDEQSAKGATSEDQVEAAKEKLAEVDSIAAVELEVPPMLY